MRVSGLAFSLFLLSESADAFCPLHTSKLSSSLKSANNLHEFDYLLNEDASSFTQQQSRSRRRIHMNDDSATVLTSSIASTPGAAEDLMGEYFEDEVEVDPYADIGLEQVNSQAMVKINDENQSITSKFEDKFKTMDLQDVVTTLIFPSILAFVALRWGFNKASARVGKSMDAALESFSSEMIYHDGDFEEMKLCHSDYSKKLAFLGPTKSSAMLKTYLESYAKKRTVTPQGISSLSYVFTLFKLSEEKAGQLLVSLCRDMGDEKISTAGKLLFFGSRILKSPEGKAALLPIKDQIRGTYREEAVSETMVETSQQAIGEAAYRTAVLAFGKQQETITVGWEVLGLTREVATRIFEEEAEEGFLSEREKMYGGQSRKYDRKGNLIDKEGELVDANAQKAADDEAEEESEPTSNVYECTECGYTLFIAKGREFKFYGDDFKCPECKCGKDKFKARDMDAE